MCLSAAMVAGAAAAVDMKGLLSLELCSSHQTV